MGFFLLLLFLFLFLLLQHVNTQCLCPRLTEEQPNTASRPFLQGSLSVSLSLLDNNKITIIYIPFTRPFG